VGVALDGAGNLFISAPNLNQVVRLDALGGLSLIAGSGAAGYAGDNGPAVLGSLNKPTGLALDSGGNLYIADLGNNRIRKVSNGVITTVAGNGIAGSGGNGGPATNASLNAPSYVAINPSGDLYISDSGNFWIRRVSGGVITVFAGDNSSGYSGDGGPATMAQLKQPAGLAIDAAGDVYVADSANNCIRMISNGVITTVAGGGTSLNNAVPPLSAQLKSPTGIAVDASGNLYIADLGDYRLREITNGTMITVAGVGCCSNRADGGPATSAGIQPAGVAVDPSGTLYVTDQEYYCVRKVLEGTISTIGINGGLGGGQVYSGGGYGPALSALFVPATVAVDSSGDVYVGDNGRDLWQGGFVWKVANEVILPVAGGGEAGPNGAPSSSVNLWYSPSAIAVDAHGNVYLCDWDASQIYEVSNGSLTTVAGGVGSPFGENVPANSVELSQPRGLAIDSANNLYIADTGSGRIRKVSNGSISTIAGNEYTSTYGPPPGSAVYQGPNGAVMTARFGPSGLALDNAGNLYIADFGNQVIAKLSNGTLTVVAGNGQQGFGGDNGPATSATLNIGNQTFLAVDSTGNLFVTDNNRVRMISNGVIATIAGNGSVGTSADNVPATSVPIVADAVAVDSQGRVYVADGLNLRVRVLIPSSAPCTFSVAARSAQVGAGGGAVAVPLNTVPGCPWTISGVPDWITVSSGTSASGPQILTLSAQANSGAVRVGELSIAGLSFVFTQAGSTAPLPQIISAGVAAGPPVIAQNAWITIKGANLVPTNAPSAGEYWSNAPSFSTGQMPTELDGVSVTVNGNPAYVWWFCSAVTSPVCPNDQINVLTPLDSTTGNVQIIVTNRSVSSPPFTATLQTVSPSFLVFDGAKHIAAVHSNSSLVGPTNLYPGLTTPAASGETISLFATGFGLPTTALSAGSATQSGSLPGPIPACTVGGDLAHVTAADLISPGLYQLNVVIPAAAASGDNPVVCAFDGADTPIGLITKQ
jgi:trimeric autotransporter adhesin